MTANALSTNVRAFDDDALAAITSFDDALRALDTGGIVAESITNYGNGFSVVENKDTLIGVPFVILDWRFNESGMSDEPFVSLTIVTKNGDKLIVNDGSTGIRAQMQAITRRRAENGNLSQSGLVVPNGLTVSRYMYADADGKERPAVTYYLSESA